jgi:tetratricopeptide (TPR) repeat protein
VKGLKLAVFNATDLITAGVDEEVTTGELVELLRTGYTPLLETIASTEAQVRAGRLELLKALFMMRFRYADKAQEAAENGLKIFSRLVEADKTNLTYRVGLATSHEVVGRAAVAGKDMDTALKAFEACRLIRQQLHDEEKTNPVRRAALATAHVWLGLVLQAQGKTETAKANYNTALEGRQQLCGDDISKADLSRQRQLAEAHERLGNLALENYQLPEAETRYRKAETILTPLSESHQDNSLIQLLHFKVQIGLGQTHLLNNQRSKGVAIFEKCLSPINDNRYHSPGDLEWDLLELRCRTGLALADFKLVADVNLLNNQARTFTELVAFARSLAVRDKHNRILQGEVAALEMALATVHYQLGHAKESPAENFKMAVEIQSSAVQRLENLTTLDPSNNEWKKRLTAARKFLDVQKMRLSGTTDPKKPGLADPMYLSVVRTRVETARKAFENKPTAAAAEELASLSMLLVDQLVKGDHEPYLTEARELLKQSQDALQKMKDSQGLNRNQTEWLTMIDGRLKMLGDK